MMSLNLAGTLQAISVINAKNTGCDKDTFLLSYKWSGDLPETKEKIIDMSMNGSGIWNIARVLRVSANTLMRELKKAKCLDPPSLAV
ncbi:IS1-like element transposase, partial [Piscirickettsia litoralis]|uniref:IS1-like element transposase n=1 Tax=Piscirickettsia litoralis TaxID=1891921 RepID=UPI001F1BFE78